MKILPEEVVVSPSRSMDMLSQLEVRTLREKGHGGLHETFRRCALAVLNCGGEMDSARQVFQAFRDFEVELIQQERGLRLRLRNAPASAFVDGRLIRGIREHLFSVLRDVVYVSTEIDGRLETQTSAGITNAIFHILRNARAMRPRVDPNLVVCWGGHAIGREEYDYSKAVGYELGLRGLNVCTGCGPGAMKGPMKGAAVGHAKQRMTQGRYVGISEPGIIAAEAPNPIVNELIIMPDIEKRLEAFARIGHGFVIFPGGVGTAEELLFLLGILLDSRNRDIPFPLILTGPASARSYFERLDAFVRESLGQKAADCYSVTLGNAEHVAREMVAGMSRVREYRRDTGDAFYFNWRLSIDRLFQEPFDPTHQAMASLQLNRDLEAHVLAANLRRTFSGIVAGNVKDDGIRAVEKNGPYEIHAEPAIMDSLDGILQAFVAQSRMRLPGEVYTPCYRIVR
jgi:predicted Rossmann-fold nucleotide-binding protein